MKQLRSLWVRSEGTTAIEYALIGALISIVIFAAATTIGTEVAAMFASVNAGFSN